MDFKTSRCITCSAPCFIYETGYHSNYCKTHLKPCFECNGVNTFGGSVGMGFCRKCCKGNLQTYIDPSRLERVE